MPPGLRKSGIPDSVLMPAPVNTTARRDCSISRFSAATPVSSLIGLLWQNRRSPTRPASALGPAGRRRAAGQRGGGDMPKPPREQAQHDREHDVAAGLQPMVLPRQLERLQAES